MSYSESEPPVEGEKIPPVKVPPRDKNATAFDDAVKPRRRWGFWKSLGALTLAGVAGAAGYLGFTKSGQDFTHEVRTVYVPAIHNLQTARANPDLIFTEAQSDHVNILLVGRDVNYKQVYENGRNVAHTVDKDTPARSDTMIVVSLDRHGKVIRMVSLPRDARVRLPENKEGVRRAKLNAAHAYGGVPLLKQTLHDELGLTIHHYAVINFGGFKNVIDEIGGVYVDVIGALQKDGSRTRLKYDDNWGNLHIDLKPGKQWLNGQQAHDYVRFRMDIEGDPGRIRRQQSVMRALARQLKTVSPLKLPSIVKEIRQQFDTDLNDTQLMSAGFFAQGLGESAKVQPVTLYGSYSTRGSVVLNRSRNEALLKTMFGPTFDPERFLVRSPSTNGYEFGPESKDGPETRAILIQAGLLKPGPGDRIAPASVEESGAAVPVKDEVASSTPETALADSGTPSDRMFSANIGTEEPRRTRHRETRSETSLRRDVGSEPRIEAQSPLPQPEAAPIEQTHELSVESPIPQPE